ncbi:Protein of unknown function DUF833 [Kalmanozyma brasiliensis GHG001]|nr:Protein of unknown function DUF833 [Kalmanozyma brasiliensis GHG001]KAF6766976.1 Protein of unknown function DUF833 [Kalmanozyma brasiliensis GHG001]
MCVIFWTTSSPAYSLVIASNRDEFLSRPTLPASWHDFSNGRSSSSSSSILSARDSTGGGTWLGITRNGAFATLTNFTELSAPLPPGLDAFESRGRLVRDWLSHASTRSPAKSVGEAEMEVHEYLARVGEKGERFPGFNLLIGLPSDEGTVVGYITNRTADGQVERGREGDIFLPTTQSPAGMSNSTLTNPWAKVTSGSARFNVILAQAPQDDQDAVVEQLFDLLWTSSTPKPAQRSELRNSVLISPLELPAATEGGRDWYATRTSTVIVVGRDGRARLVERDTFRIENGEAVLVNGPEGSGAVQGRSGGERVFEWHIG